MTEINNRIEEVKKILEIVWDNAIGRMRLPPKTAVEEFPLEVYADQICQLFSQPLEKPVRHGYRPARLNDKELREKCLSALSPKEVTEAIYMANGKLYPTAFYRLRKAQVDKDLALLQPKIEEAFTKGITQYREEICPMRIEEARRQERERIIALLKRATNYKVMQRMKNGRYFESVVHDEEWERFGQALKE